MSKEVTIENRASYFELIKDISNHSHQKTSVGRIAYKFAVTIAGFIVAIGLYFSY